MMANKTHSFPLAQNTSGGIAAGKGGNAPKPIGSLERSEPVAAKGGAQ